MKYRSRTATKQMWLVIISAILLTFFLLYIALIISLKDGINPTFWALIPTIIGSIWGFATLMWNTLEKRKTVENGNREKEKEG